MVKVTDINTTNKPDLSLEGQVDRLRAVMEENLRYTKAIRESSTLEAQKELQQLLKENLKISKDLYVMTKKINRWIFGQRIWGVVKFLLILIPFVLGAIYLPPLLNQALKPYQDFWRLNQQVSESAPAGMLEQLSNFIQIGNETSGQNNAN